MKSETFTGQRTWNHRFSHLNKSGLDHPYLFILGLARSKGEIIKFHNLLPGDRRVLRNDLIDLQDFWTEYIRPSINEKQKRLPLFENEEVIRWLLGQHCTENINSATEYYFEYLHRKQADKTGVFSGNISFENSPIVSCVDRCGSGDFHFTIQMFDARFGLGCYLSPGQDKQLIVRIMANQYMLNEELTYKLGQLPAYRMTTCSSGFAGRQVDFSYCFEGGNNFLPFLKEGNDNKTEGVYIMNYPGFLDLLAQTLNSNDIPVGRIIIPLKVIGRYVPHRLGQSTDKFFDTLVDQENEVHRKTIVV